MEVTLRSRTTRPTSLMTRGLIAMFALLALGAASIASTQGLPADEEAIAEEENLGEALDRDRSRTTAAEANDPRITIDGDQMPGPTGWFLAPIEAEESSSVHVVAEPRLDNTDDRPTIVSMIVLQHTGSTPTS